jgi:GH25 family lysozyme M1 (1,4-beta-N-acetylmuramidase)
MNGIDVSNWQPRNITELVDYDFVIIKATEGTNYVSPACDAQYQAAKKRGKKLGVYHFASGLDPVAEANFFIDNVQGYIGEAVLVLDWEAHAISKGADYVRKFVNQVKARTQVPPIIYASASPLQAAGIPALAQELNCGLWVAAYPDNVTDYGYQDQPQLLGGVIRQWTSVGRLSGYDGNLDLNRSTLTPEQWDKYAKGGRDGSSPAPTPAPARASNDEVANQVIAGSWGNGEDRKNKLSAAGYDPATIQNLVNTKLGQTAKKSKEDVATEVLGGLWGDGNDRVNRLKNAGYDPNTIQGIVNSRLGISAQSAAVYITVPSGPAGYLGNLAAQYGTSVDQIVKWNSGKYPISANRVNAGWVIRVK